MLSKRMIKALLVVVILCLPVMGVLAQTPPATIVVEKEALYPEGIAWDAANQRFLVGSINEGSIYAVSDAGDFSVMVEDEVLISTIGLHLNGEQLLVANADPGVGMHTSEATAGRTAGLGVYDLNTGEQVA